jgi:hypothetical protein
MLDRQPVLLQSPSRVTVTSASTERPDWDDENVQGQPRPPFAGPGHGVSRKPYTASSAASTRPASISATRRAWSLSVTSA